LSFFLAPLVQTNYDSQNGKEERIFVHKKIEKPPERDLDASPNPANLVIQHYCHSCKVDPIAAWLWDRVNTEFVTVQFCVEIKQ